MNDRNRRTPNRRAEQTGPKFCSRCGGALTAQSTTNQRNVCRCKKTNVQAVQHPIAVAPVSQESAIVPDVTPEATPVPTTSADVTQE